MSEKRQVDCSVIIPFCNEMPQIAFTIQAMIEELEGLCKYEIIAVDNRSCPEFTCTINESSTACEGNFRLAGSKPFAATPRSFTLRQRNYFMPPKADGGTINTMFFRDGRCKYITYDERLSHWQAKNRGIEESTGRYLFFLDSHCIMKRGSMKALLDAAEDISSREKLGGVHSYINYMLEPHCLEYRVQEKFFGYQFCSNQKEVYQENGKRLLRFPTKPYKVCVMSTCGMMCPRSTIEELGGWNRELGIYGGGESYMNWKQSTCGYPHWIVPQAWCWHFADNRGYSWNHSDFVRNSFIAAYVVGGEKSLQQQATARAAPEGRDRPAAIAAIADNVRETCSDDRAQVKQKQKFTFDEYIAYWKAHPGTWK